MAVLSEAEFWDVLEMINAAKGWLVGVGLPLAWKDPIEHYCNRWWAQSMEIKTFFGIPISWIPGEHVHMTLVRPDDKNRIEEEDS